MRCSLKFGYHISPPYNYGAHDEALCTTINLKYNIYYAIAIHI